MTIITVANQKGGVAKTTTAVTIAAGLAELGHSVTLIDCDPQGNCAEFLGLDPFAGLYNLLITNAGINTFPTPLPNLRLIGGDVSTVDVETLLRTSTRMSPTTALKSVLANIAGIVVIDTAPSLSSVQLAALYAADWLLIPTTPEYASETGRVKMVDTVGYIQSMGGKLELLGILPTMVKRTIEHRQTIIELRSEFPGLILPPVRSLIALGEAPRAGQPIWSYAPDSDAAADYGAVLNSIIKRLGI